MSTLITQARKRWAAISPYVVLIAVVPGGIALALLLFLQRRRQTEAVA